jgi:hypothetical protein
MVFQPCAQAVVEEFYLVVAWTPGTKGVSYDQKLWMTTRQ